MAKMNQRRMRLISLISFFGNNIVCLCNFTNVHFEFLVNFCDTILSILVCFWVGDLGGWINSFSR